MSYVTSFTYDLAGNITGIADAVNGNRSQTLQYDLLGRVTQGTGFYGNDNYSYDAVGNRLTRTLGTASTTYAYTANSNRLTGATAGGSTRACFKRRRASPHVWERPVHAPRRRVSTSATSMAAAQSAAKPVRSHLKSDWIAKLTATMVPSEVSPANDISGIGNGLCDRHAATAICNVKRPVVKM